MSARAMAYQRRITGLGENVGYLVKGTKFDGFINGVLIDAKGPGYAKFVRDGVFRSWYRGADGLVEQAQRQLVAAAGTPIRWHVAEEAAANAIRNLLRSRGITGIDVVFTP